MIVTAKLDDAAFAKLDAERQAHFPPERNFLTAHLTLFHALTEDAAPVIAEACKTTAPLRARITSVRSLGRGVAYGVDAPELVRFRGVIAGHFTSTLTRQDAQKFSPHVTIQNKVTPEAARALLEQLTVSFAPYPFEILGVALWHYRGGPWEHIADLAFSAAAPAAP